MHTCRVVEKVLFNCLNAASLHCSELEENIKVLLPHKIVLSLFLTKLKYSFLGTYYNYLKLWVLPANFIRRCLHLQLQYVDYLYEIAGEAVVVVSHGACIETLYKWANAKGSYAGKIDNASVAVFQLYGEDNWTLKLWGDVTHLTQNWFLHSSSLLLRITQLLLRL